MQTGSFEITSPYDKQSFPDNLNVRLRLGTSRTAVSMSVEKFAANAKISDRLGEYSICSHCKPSNVYLHVVADRNYISIARYLIVF